MSESKSTNKKQLIRDLSKRTLLSQKEGCYVLNELLEIILEKIKSGEEVNIVGFGKFYPYEHKPRPVRNPKTLEEMILEPYVSIKFKPCLSVKKELKKPEE